MCVKKFKNKIASLLILSIVMMTLSSCGEKHETMTINGVSYDKDLVVSGYYIDKAGLTDAQMLEAIKQSQLIKKPKNLGTVKLATISELFAFVASPSLVTGPQVEAAIEEMRDKEVGYVGIKEKRSTKMNDRITVKYDVKDSTNKSTLDSKSEQVLVIGKNEFPEDFNKKLLNRKAGSYFDFDYTFPEGYPGETYGGKKVTYSMIISYIEEISTPDLDYEFVKKNTTKGSTTLDEYREELRERLNFKNRYEADQQIYGQAMSSLIQNSYFEPTEVANAWAFSTLVNNIKLYATINNTPVDQVFMQGSKTVQEAFDTLKSQSSMLVSQELIIQELVKMYKVTVDENDMRKWYDEMAIMTDQDKEFTYEDYKKVMGVDYIKENTLMNKALEKLKENVNVIYYETVPEGE